MEWLSQMPRISSGASRGPRLLSIGNMDKFTLWSRAWTLIVFSLPIQTQMKCWRRLSIRVTHWRNSRWGFYESSLDQTLFLYRQPSVSKELCSAIVEDNAVTKTVCWNDFWVCLHCLFWTDLCLCWISHLATKAVQSAQWDPVRRNPISFLWWTLHGQCWLCSG